MSLTMELRSQAEPLLSLILASCASSGHPYSLDSESLMLVLIDLFDYCSQKVKSMEEVELTAQQRPTQSRLLARLAILDKMCSRRFLRRIVQGRELQVAKALEHDLSIGTLAGDADAQMLVEIWNAHSMHGGDFCDALSAVLARALRSRGSTENRCRRFARSIVEAIPLGNLISQELHIRDDELQARDIKNLEQANEFAQNQISELRVAVHDNAEFVDARLTRLENEARVKRLRVESITPTTYSGMSTPRTMERTLDLTTTFPSMALPSNAAMPTGFSDAPSDTDFMQGPRPSTGCCMPSPRYL